MCYFLIIFSILDNYFIFLYTIKHQPMTNFDEYILQGELHKQNRHYVWQITIGLQDRLKVSDYLVENSP